MIDEADVITVQGAWTTYDLAEREIWDEYAADPTFVNGRIYLAGEQLLRRRCDRAVRVARYQQPQKVAV